MKVLHLTNTLSSGGAELHLITLCRDQKGRGADVVVSCLREKVKDSRSLRPDFEKEGIRVVDLDADSRYDLRFPFRASHLIQKEQPDIVHTHLPRADLAGAFAHWRNPSVPWICSVHGLYETHWSGSWTMPLFKKIWRRADAVIAISHAVKDWLVDKQNVPVNKVTVIHYGIELKRFEKTRENFRKEWSLGEDPVIGTIGRLEPLKGHQTLIRSMPEIRKHFPNAKLLIAGHDPWGYGRNLSAVIRELGLDKSVRLLGFQTDIPRLMNTFDVFAFASESEGFGQVLIEAMAAEKPVLSTGMAPMSEIVENGVTGFLVEKGKPKSFADAILALLSNRDLARKMGQQGRERARRHFQSSVMADRVMDLYQFVLRNRLGSHAQ